MRACVRVRVRVRAHARVWFVCVRERVGVGECARVGVRVCVRAYV